MSKLSSLVLALVVSSSAILKPNRKSLIAFWLKVCTHEVARLTARARRFRDTFSVELLNAGVPIEQVATLLAHESVRVTERSFNPWVKSRQDRLDADLESAWAQDPLALVLTKGTREVHGNNESIN